MISRPILEKDAELKFPHALLISASAGSGKTYTLTRRYVQFLLSDIVPGNNLQNILAVTFTNNAAKEMKVRILNWLKELALDKNCARMEETLTLVSLSRDEVHKRAAVLVDRVISDYCDFHVQTIDSFLARVMTASVDELKLPLNPEITMAYGPLIDLALYALFSRVGQADFPARTVDKFLAVLPKTGFYPWNPAGRIRETFNNFLNREGRTEGVVSGPPGDCEDLLKARFAETLKACAVLQKRYGDPGLFKDGSLAALEAKNPTAFLASYSFTYGILNGQKKKTFPAAWEKEIERLNGLVISLTELNAAAWYHPYVGIYGRFKEELERAKHGKTDVIHINDIAKKLSAYINAGRIPELYLKLGERLSHFLIDEFQDTNRLQWNVLRPLVEEALSKTGSLFVVGDIKQAIYMFRNADYKIMRDFLDKAEGKKSEAENISLRSLGGELKLVNLPVNYRSDGEVLAYVNKLFKGKLKNSPELIGSDLTELTSYEQAVTAGRVKDGYVRTDILELEDPSEPEKQKDWLLKIIAGARGRYPLNEIAILVSKNKRIEPIVEWLTGASIPVASLSSLDIRKRKVVAELIAYLRFLETPSDGLSFAAFLTGDVFAALTKLPREEMMRFIFESRAGHKSQVTGYKPGAANPPILESSSPLLYALFRNHPIYKEYWDKYLDEPFRKAGYLPLYELISLIYNSFRLFENFPQEQASLARFLEAVISLEAGGVTGPRAFIEYASGDNEDRAAVFSIDLPEYIAAVRVMTFHKSKGLGFSVVINMLFDERGPVEPMYFEERDGAIHVYHITKEAAEVSAGLRPVYKNHKTDSDVQDLNVLYVISTRARHELYNLAVKKRRKTPAKEPKLLDIFETYESAAAPPSGFLGEKQPARAPENPMDITAAGRAAESRFDALKPTYTGFFETAEGELAHEMLAHIAPICHGAQVTGHKPDSADPALSTLRSTLSILYSTYAPKYPFKFNEAKIVKTLVDFLNLPQPRELFAARPDRAVLTEAEFIDRNGNLFRMDRVIIDKDTVTVVDFKTGAESPEKHSAQMKNYLAIISEVYGKPTKGVLAYVDLRKIAEI